MQRNTDVDQFLIDGCGRCSLYKTPQCKVHNWQEELKLLRKIMLDCGLTEEFKWKQPCYTYNNQNVLIVTALKEFCSVAFFKGALLNDPEKILVAPGKNSQASRQIKITSVKQVVELEPVIKAYVYEAVEVEKAGLKVIFKKVPELRPKELQVRLDEDPLLKDAFESLTPGRQRGYILYFSGAKQSKTRKARIEKHIPRILQGKGIHDR
jgi:uncharacterized protein YdeI (YjbR/CyaY-like superfamily)